MNSLINFKWNEVKIIFTALVEQDLLIIVSK